VKTVAVIPARYASRRFPGKPLAELLGRPMIAWVVEAAQRASRVEQVYVATDDDRIATAAHRAGAEVRLTRVDHATGTDRVAEAVAALDADVILNLQGDEPLLDPDAVDSLAAVFADDDVRMATLALRGVTDAERADPHVVKIVVDDHGDALYFSRAPIPYRNLDAGAVPLADGTRERAAWRHVGTYGFRAAALREFVAAPRQGLEALEDLEQLRALRLGWKIRVVEVASESICVDRPEDVARVESMLRDRGEGVAR
jgi:3-deoxy-manno-octulosonate cytidylyltransferase (CMP-KDO synthetase)